MYIHIHVHTPIFSFISNSLQNHYIYIYLHRYAHTRRHTVTQFLKNHNFLIRKFYKWACIFLHWIFKWSWKKKTMIHTKRRIFLCFKDFRPILQLFERWWTKLKEGRSYHCILSQNWNNNFYLRHITTETHQLSFAQIVAKGIYHRCCACVSCVCVCICMYLCPFQPF